MRKTLGTIVIIVTLGMVASCVIMTSQFAGQFEGGEPLMKESLMLLELDGVILDSDEILEALHDYADDDEVKGIVLRINSPGGAVGPSQEIYAELKRVRDVLKKPIVASCASVAASGAYYAAVATSKIVTNPGSLLGSIGVIMEFANLEDLYGWAKIKRYSIKTGPYKDSGAEYRPMRDDERKLFQSMADEVLEQFKGAIVEGRKLSPEKVTEYADGRVFTGATAVKLGLADEIGTLEDAIRIAAKLAGMDEKDPEVFKPRRRHESLMDFFGDISGDSDSRANVGRMAADTFKQMLRPELLGQPLFLMPGTFAAPAGR